jgi:hypothetical protein
MIITVEVREDEYDVDPCIATLCSKPPISTLNNLGLTVISSHPKGTDSQQESSLLKMKLNIIIIEKRKIFRKDFLT